MYQTRRSKVGHNVIAIVGISVICYFSAVRDSEHHVLALIGHQVGFGQMLKRVVGVATDPLCTGNCQQSTIMTL